MAAIETDMPVKPRILIADDSRIVRATLIKHIEGMFDFREACNGEEAWEMLLADRHIKVVITDITMPRLDGYGLLQRIRHSSITRLREIPVVVISGSDEQAERERVIAAGASDLITKGIGTAHLVSRLDVLSKLTTTRQEFRRSLEALVQDVSPESLPALPTQEGFNVDASALLQGAVQGRRNFVLLSVRLALRRIDAEGACGTPPASVMAAIGQLLRRTIRQTDHVAQTGQAEFMLATGSINFDAAIIFARRICHAIADADIAGDASGHLFACCGVASLSERGSATEGISLLHMQEIARRRAELGIAQGFIGAVGEQEEAGAASGMPLATPAIEHAESGIPDAATLLRWIREGRQEQVRPHLDKLPAELQSLAELVMKRSPS